MKKIAIAVILLVLLFHTAPTTFAQSANDKYIWEHFSPQPISTQANDLKQKLEQEVQKIIASGHLTPFRANYGEGPPQYYWYHAYDTVYTLSLAYLYVSTAMQNSIKTYLQTEMATYKPWTATLLSTTTGSKREPDELTDSERGTLPGEYSNRPKLFGLYALWLYSYNTNDWTIVDTNWTAIKSFYQSYAGEAGQQYSGISGAIGMARIAQKKNDSLLSSVITAINNGLSSGTNFSQFALNSENAYKWNANGWDWTKTNIYRGFQFIDISPEIGRYFYDNATLKSQVIGGSPSDIYSLSRAEYFFPLWYMAQAPTWSRYYGEGSGTPIDTKAMIFPIKAWVQQKQASELRSYIDIPDAIVGDYYYMQNLVRTIEAHGSPCWKDVRNPTASCSQASSQQSSPQVAGASSVSASPLVDRMVALFSRLKNKLFSRSNMIP